MSLEQTPRVKTSVPKKRLSDKTAGGINSYIMLEYNSTAYHAARQQDESKYFAWRLIMKTIREKQYRCYKLFLTSLMGLVFLLWGQMVTYAAEYTVTDTSTVLYTAKQTSVYAEPDIQTAAIAVLDANLPVAVTGITSNGWFRVDLGGAYYIEGNALIAPEQAAPVSAPAPAYTPPAYQDAYIVTVNSIAEAQAAVFTGMQLHASHIEITIPHIPADVRTNKLFNYAQNIRTYSHANAPGEGISYKTGYGRSSSGSKTQYIMKVNYYSTIEEEMLTDARIEQLLPTYNTGSDYDKIRAVHDFVCKQNVYSYKTANGAPGYNFDSAYDVLFHGQSICSGYALTFQRFMDRMGIPCYFFVTKVNGVGHMLNIVQLDGQWYTVDCTYDDKNQGFVHTYFLKGQSRFGEQIAKQGIVLSPTDYKRPY